MDETPNMQTSTLSRASTSSIKDTLSHSGLSPEQALALERAMANIHDFVPSYWINQFIAAQFTRDQAETLVDLFVRRSSRSS